MSDITNVSSGKTKKKKKRKIKLWKVLLVLFLAIIVGSGIYLWLWLDKTTSDFDVNSFISKSSSVMCYYDDETGSWVDFEWIGTEQTGTRDNVYYEDLPQVLIDAVVATEDSRFFTHSGIDLPRIAKAAISLATHGTITSGGSTITQQLIKNAYYIQKEHKVNQWERKLGEIYLALQVERNDKITKEDILVDYLNMIQFGRGLNTLGISAASHYYFDKDVQDLTLPEAALLAGVLNQPSKYDPYYNLEEATARRNTVLTLMKNHGYITEKQEQAAKAIPVENTLKKQSSSSSSTYTPYQSYYDNVIAELKEIGVDPYTDSIRVYTNMDVDLQEKAESVAKGELFTWSNNVLETSLSLEETHTGKVLAVLGGREYVGVQNPYDTTTARTNRTRERHQPGSSLKPIITYCAAFEFLDWSTGQYISNETYNYYGNEIHNWDDSSGGTISLTEALKLSYNNPAFYTTEAVRDEIGTSKYVDYLESFGFDMSDESFDLQYAIGGWVHGASSLQIAGAYSALSNEGTYIEPHCIYKIEYIDSDKADVMVTDDAIGNAKEVVSAESAFMIREVMKSYSRERYTGLDIPYNVCGKSGTTNYDDALCEQYGLPQYSAKDSLLNAFTEDYAISVWVGYDTEGYYQALTETERQYAGLTAGYLLSAAHNGVTKNTWSQPEGVVQTQMIAGFDDPYVKPISSTPSSMIITAWFKKTNVPEAVSVDIDGHLSDLESFDVKYDEEKNEITVKFPTYKSDSEEKKYAKYFGDPVYTVDIIDLSTDEVLATETSEDPSFTLEYQPSSSVSVVGYYSRSKYTSFTSNKISETIKIKGDYENSVSYETTTITQMKTSSTKDLLDAMDITITYEDETIPGTSSDVSVIGKFDLTTPGTYSIQISYEDFISDPITITVTSSSSPDSSDPHGDGYDDYEPYDDYDSFEGGLPTGQPDD